jgi:hypothetical protein
VLPKPRAIVLLAVLAIAGPAAAAVSEAATKPVVKAPKSGTYPGKRVTLYVVGKAIDLASIEFDCGEITGRTGLNDVHLRKTSKGYSFDIAAHGGVTYSDEQQDENGTIRLEGRFTRGATKAAGFFRVVTPRCGNTGGVRFSVARRN